MIAKIKKLFQLIKYLGFPWLLFRVYYFFKKKSRFLIWQMPCSSWDSNKEKFSDWQENKANFFFNSLDNSFPKKEMLQKADDILNGYFYYFSSQKIYLGQLPDWHFNFIDNSRAPKNKHWSLIDDFACGDIKIIWEINRFSFVYNLVRAYAMNKNEKYAEKFWQLLENWRENNQPNYGVNWKCGQEIAFRLMAWIFGLYDFSHAKATTLERQQKLIQMIFVSADRIEKNIHYALSQKNNHGISEAMGLWTVGVLFPNFKQSKRWEKLGKKQLEKQAKKLIDEEGAFSQHSMNYHRVMLQDYLWVLRLAELNHRQFSDQLKQRIQKAGEFLYQLMDLKTGRLPNYGANDGAFILPLNNCDDQNFKPIVQSIYYFFHHARCFEAGEWDEDLFWLFGKEALISPINYSKQVDFIAKKSGYYTLHNDHGFIFTRAAKYHYRPSQADLLHVDLWWKGINLLKDAGTYSYHAEKPFDHNPFMHTQFHNTVTVDHRSQMDQVSRFLLLPWATGKMNCLKESKQKQLKYLEVWHNGYMKLKDPVKHIRGILRLAGDYWLIIDRLHGKQKHHFALHYLCENFPHQLEKGNLILETPQGNYHLQIQSDHFLNYSLACASQTAEGWCSPYYHQKESALSFTACAETQDIYFLTLLGSGEIKIEMQNPFLKIKAGGSFYEIYFQHGFYEKSLLSSVQASGQLNDYLDMS